MQASVRQASSVHVAGQLTNNGTPISVDLDMHRNGDVSGTVSQNGAPFQVIGVGKVIYIKATRAFLQAVKAPTSACAVVCGKWLQLTSAEARQLTGDLSMSSLTAPLTSGQVPTLTEAGSATVNGQSAWVLRASDGSTLDVSSASQHYPLAASGRRQPARGGHVLAVELGAAAGRTAGEPGAEPEQPQVASYPVITSNRAQRGRWPVARGILCPAGWLCLATQGGAVSIFGSRKTQMATAQDALPGRDTAMRVPDRHEVLGTPLLPPYPAGTEVAEFALGCFWGAEKNFWQTPGVVSTAVGYEGGFTPNPTYEEVCSGRTGHAEAVRVVFDPAKVSYAELLKVFWESHDPTQGMRQGNDLGTQYRSAIFYQSPQQQAEAEESRASYQKRLSEAGYGDITTEIVPAGDFYFAEDYHQQYLSDAKNPYGYCPDHGTGVSCPIGVVKADG